MNIQRRLMIPMWLILFSSPVTLSSSDSLRWSRVNYADSLDFDSRGQSDIVAALNYPEFTGSGAHDVLFGTVKNFVFGGLISGDTLAGGKDVLAEMAGEYELLLGEFPDYSFPWELQRNVDVLYNDSAMVSLRFFEFHYSGGAHPNTAQRLLSYDQADGRFLDLSDIHRRWPKMDLVEAGERQFRMDWEIADTLSLNEAGWWFEDDCFYLPDNFALLDSGLLFLYNPYEIGPYYLGATELYIPFKDR